MSAASSRPMLLVLLVGEPVLNSADPTVCFPTDLEYDVSGVCFATEAKERAQVQILLECLPPLRGIRHDRTQHHQHIQRILHPEPEPQVEGHIHRNHHRIGLQCGRMEAYTWYIFEKRKKAERTEKTPHIVNGSNGYSGYGTRTHHNV
ncbi:hypothetical protein MLD38_019440 [Melastoma candidum]|uniref:Uncharacterized protein n=1 Tax=Melastoma candidum TaxID=119954 RepID=A0ACB9QX79_9MYRT|nr:hypothetical protein MLD38_019440 [Melastoma candidum]